MKMELFIYIILGIIQGFTEPLPISSSGHLMIFKDLFEFSLTDLNFEIIVNFGSFIAIFFIFRKVIFELVSSFFIYIFNKDKRSEHLDNFKYCWLIVVASIPVAIIGFFAKDYIESLLSIKLVGCALLVTGLFLFLVRNKNGKKDDSKLSFKDAIIIGLFQVVALFPGISRSGATLIGCLFTGLDNKTALKYTFMLYFPVSVGTMLLSIADLASIDSSLMLNYGIGMIASMIVTYFAYKWFAKLVTNGNLWKFSIYCFIVGILTIIFL